MLTVGVLVVLAVTFPAADVATLLGAGGVVALAAGFAFQDLLETAMSGILLLLLRQPFAEGDVIEVEGAVGVVRAMTIRETRIRRSDRQVMVVMSVKQTDDEAGMDIPFPIRTLDAGDSFSEAVRHLARDGQPAGA